MYAPHKLHMTVSFHIKRHDVEASTSQLSAQRCGASANFNAKEITWAQRAM
jgi:hypothetical protein